MRRQGRRLAACTLLVALFAPCVAAEEGAEEKGGGEKADPVRLSEEERQIVEDLELLEMLKLLEEMELVRTVMEDAS